MQTRRSKLQWATGLLGALIMAVAAGCGTIAPIPASGPGPEATEEITNVGYGTQAAEDVTGSVASITEKEIGNQRVARVEELLQSRVPGLQVIRSAGGFSLRIRGTTSLMGSNEPLLVIDGIPVQRHGVASALAGLNPRDIKRIDVLKGASAAIYGSRSANGVILISTRGTW